MSGARVRTAVFVAAGLVVAIALAAGVSHWASSEPDGLEKVAADHGLDADEAPSAVADGPLADYQVRGLDDPTLATGVAGVIGVAVTFAFAGGLVLLARRRGPAPEGTVGRPGTRSIAGRAPPGDRLPGGP